MLNEMRAVDAHVAGTPVRLLISGIPRPAGSTMEKRRTWFQRQADHIRRHALLEPRGHQDLVGALLTEAVSKDADAGILFLDADSYPSTSVAGLVAVTTMAVEKGLITKRAAVVEPDVNTMTLAFDTPAGNVTVTATVAEEIGAPRVRSVRVSGEPSFVVHAGCPIAIGQRQMRVDLAYSGAFYAIVDAESAGIALVPSRLSELRRLARDICAALEGHDALVHPVDARAATLAAVVFTGPPETSDAHLRSVSITAHGRCDRSGLSGVSALMAVLAAMGLLETGAELIHHGLMAPPSRGHLLRQTRVGDVPAVIADVEARAWSIGEQTLTVDADDPLRDGFVL